MEGIIGGRSRELAPNEVFQLSRKAEEAMFSLLLLLSCLDDKSGTPVAVLLPAVLLPA